MNLVVLLIILLLLFGGGGLYVGGPVVGGSLGGHHSDCAARLVVDRQPEPRVSVDFCYPRPTNGIFVAITVMNCTFASSGRLAI